MSGRCPVGGDDGEGEAEDRIRPTVVQTIKISLGPGNEGTKSGRSASSAN